MSKNTAFAREGYLRENYHYFHLRDTAGQERDFHFHEFDKIAAAVRTCGLFRRERGIRAGAVVAAAGEAPHDTQGADRQE